MMMPLKDRPLLLLKVLQEAMKDVLG